MEQRHVAPVCFRQVPMRWLPSRPDKRGEAAANAEVRHHELSRHQTAEHGSLRKRRKKNAEHCEGVEKESWCIRYVCFKVYIDEKMC